MTLLVRYCRQRLPLRLLVPVVVGLTAAAIWAAGTEAPRLAMRAGVLILLLMVQFRLWDDLEDAAGDRVHHPERLLPRVPPGPFRVAAVGLAGAALALASVVPASAVALLLLDLAFVTAYRGRRYVGDTPWRYGVLLLKYPAFVVIAALATGAAADVDRLLAAAAVAYVAAAAYEGWHVHRPAVPAGDRTLGSTDLPSGIRR